MSGKPSSEWPDLGPLEDMWASWDSGPIVDVPLYEPEPESRWEQVRNVLSDKAYDARERFSGFTRRTRVAVAGGAVVVGLLAAGVGYASFTGGESTVIADTAQESNKYIDDFADQKSKDLNHDPLFRATSVSIMSDGNLRDSGGIIKVDGKYRLATVEHVVTDIYGLKKFEQPDSGVPQIGSGEQEDLPKAENAVFIPGVGVVKIPDSKSKLHLSKSSNMEDDRFVSIDLADDAQSFLADAEKAGKIKVPEAATQFKAEIGDVFYMPLADTGEKVPFLYVGDVGGPTFIPVVVLSESLDVAEAQEVLQSGIEQSRVAYEADQKQYAQEAEADGAQFIYTPPEESTLAWDTVVMKGREFAARHLDDDFEKDLGVTAWLPCMGDSGSVMINEEGGVVGTISNGPGFVYDSGDKDEPLLPAYIARQNLLNYECLSTIAIAEPNHLTD